MRVFLIHGMGRTSISMWYLKWKLQRLGHHPSLFGYLVTTTSLLEITDRFAAHVRQVVGADRERSGRPEPYAVIGHSLGNIITRKASSQLPEGLSRFVMLAPPNRSPAMARFLKNNPIFRAATRDAGQKLADPSFYQDLPVPEVPSLIIAGTRGPRAPWLPFQGRPNDSVVGLEETRLAGIPVLEVPAIHTYIMNRGDVFEALREFLDGGHGEASRQEGASAS